MKQVTFLDTEVSVDSGRIVDFGAVKITGETIHTPSMKSFLAFIEGSEFLCGHNIIHHDMKYLLTQLGDSQEGRQLIQTPMIDTLFLSPLLFPQRPYHALVKDDKLQTDELNNPLNDAMKARDLFFDEISAFQSLSSATKALYHSLLGERPEFNGFFEFQHFNSFVLDRSAKVMELFNDKICSHAPVTALCRDYPVELAYCLALILANDDYSITPPWILRQFPDTDRVMHLLRGKPCIPGCAYCNDKLDARKGLKRFFGYDAYRDFDGVPLQEQAAKAAIANKSLLAVFPTGGGKSVTFQVPALMAGLNTKSLTVVISPLQSLMKDQVDNLMRIGITDAVTVNGLLDPLERAEALRRVESGEATLLYISPESLRSKTIERLLKNRRIARFVVDEAHCFSAWGQDFRVDYLYIGEFIKKLCEEKNLAQVIPVSCFTATAKQNVVEDIRTYFKETLNLELEMYTASSARKNLHYKVLETNDGKKYDALRTLLDSRTCPTIVYVSRTRRTEELADRLSKDGYPARPYHGKLDVRTKSENQDAFMRGEVGIIVATSAFGMGVDKKDVGMVVHYDISDSLENYVQEAGRAGRDQSISADCYVLYNDEDLNKHFMLLNQTKISIQEIQQVWRAIKEATRFRARMSNSALEIARKAGWDENVHELETRVKTAIAALEHAGYVKRGQNMPRVFADSIMAHNAVEAIQKLQQSGLFHEKDEINATRIIKKLIASRSRKGDPREAAEARVDYLSEDLAIPREEVIRLIQLMREARVLADAKDLTAFLDETGSAGRAFGNLAIYRDLERFLFNAIEGTEAIVNVKELNEKAEAEGLKRVTPDRVRTVMNFWTVKSFIHREPSKSSPHWVKVTFRTKKEELLYRMEKRLQLAAFILDYLDKCVGQDSSTAEFSVLELQEAYNAQEKLTQHNVTADDTEEALLYLHRIGSLRLEGGFLVVYNGLSVERLVLDNKIRYKAEDYKNLKKYYEQKTQMIHIVGEYARKMMEDYKSALQFVEDYFQLEYSSFIRKYFRGSRGEEIQRNVTPEKFRQLFGELSVQQLKIINDRESQVIVVAAGPGSGKTRILVHKLASLLLMEDVKHEQMLMLTFSRAAATEFKKRLIGLIGNAAHFVDIKTFHSYSFDLLGKVGNLDKSIDVVSEAADSIESEEGVEPSLITRTVMVIDEAQDMDEHEFRLVRALLKKNDGMRVIAVGDDDQNIFEFRGSSSAYMKRMLESQKHKLYEMVENYRSCANLVTFTNRFAECIRERLKQTPIMPVQKENGSIRIFQYQSRNLICPVASRALQEGIKGSTCFLTYTNEEALQLGSFLRKNGLQAQPVQAAESINLYDLLEVRTFIQALDLKDDNPLITQEKWEDAKNQLRSRFAGSSNLKMCMQLLADFEAITGDRKYQSDFLMFVRESGEEDFLCGSTGGIYVSTMHKAKGREYDHVIILLRTFDLQTEADKRLLYVAMTRAKKSLDIHFTGDLLGNAPEKLFGDIAGLSFHRDNQYYHPIGSIIVQCKHKDVYLSLFRETQSAVNSLMAGHTLSYRNGCCFTSDGRLVLRFSKAFLLDMEKKHQNGYHLRCVRVKHIIYWHEKEETAIETEERSDEAHEYIAAAEEIQPYRSDPSADKNKTPEFLVVFPEVEYEK